MAALVVSSGLLSTPRERCESVHANAASSATELTEAVVAAAGVGAGCIGMPRARASPPVPVRQSTPTARRGRLYSEAFRSDVLCTAGALCCQASWDMPWPRDSARASVGYSAAVQGAQ